MLNFVDMRGNIHKSIYYQHVIDCCHNHDSTYYSEYKFLQQHIFSSLFIVMIFFHSWTTRITSITSNTSLTRILILTRTRLMPLFLWRNVPTNSIYSLWLSITLSYHSNQKGSIIFLGKNRTGWLHMQLPKLTSLQHFYCCALVTGWSWICLFWQWD